MAKKTSRPGRTLLIFFLVVAVLYGLAALGGTFKPRLGLDLEGGTRITLTADGKNISQTKLKQAKDIIESRVNGSGVVEPDVTVQGGKNIVVEVPGKNENGLVDSVKRTAQLRFRLVADCGGGSTPCQAVETPPGSSTATSTPTPTPTSTPTSTPTKGTSKGKGTKTPKLSPTKTPTSTASANPRPAPQFVLDADKKPTAKTTKKPSGTSTTLPLNPQQTQTTNPTAANPTATPTGAATTAAGASIDDPLAWATNPGTTWVSKFASASCLTVDPTTHAVTATQVNDDPNQPLISCEYTYDKHNKNKITSATRYLLSKAVIEGTSLKTASAGIPQGSLNWAVLLTLKGSAVKTFADISRALVANNGQFAIVLDGQVLSAPGFQGVITDGSAQINGGGIDQDTATSLANSLKYGALPIKFKGDPTVEFIGPSLAGSQLSAGLLAGIIGLLIVMIYCLFYYRGLGLVVIASLFVAAAVTYAAVLVLAKAAGFTLTLPGIAGLIVAVGITADSFIVYFERIRDEMRAGKSMRVAVEAGWLRARNTCLAADGVSLLASITLYIFAIGVVRGFAFALGVSTLIDIAVFFWFTKPTVTLLARREFFNGQHRLSGLSPETLGIDAPESTQLVGGKA